MKAFRLFLLAGSAASFACAAPAFGADAAAEAADKAQPAEGEIIVTAQRRAESINDVGMAIQAVDGQTLEDLRVTDVQIGRASCRERV